MVNRQRASSSSNNNKNRTPSNGLLLLGASFVIVGVASVVELEQRLPRAVPVPDFRPGLGDNHGDGFEFDASQAYGVSRRAVRRPVVGGVPGEPGQRGAQVELELLGMGFPCSPSRTPSTYNHQTVFAAAAAAAAHHGWGAVSPANYAQRKDACVDFNQLGERHGQAARGPEQESEGRGREGR